MDEILTYVNRNFGILIGYIVFFMMVYLLSAEFITADRGKGEILLFRRNNKSASSFINPVDEESPPTISRTHIPEDNSGSSTEDKKDESSIQAQNNILHWRNLCYDIPVKEGTRRITDHCDGWVKPGALTALMVRFPRIFLHSIGFID